MLPLGHAHLCKANSQHCERFPCENVLYKELLSQHNTKGAYEDAGDMESSRSRSHGTMSEPSFPVPKGTVWGWGGECSFVRRDIHKSSRSGRNSPKGSRRTHPQGVLRAVTGMEAWTLEEGGREEGGRREGGRPRAPIPVPPILTSDAGIKFFSQQDLKMEYL